MMEQDLKRIEDAIGRPLSVPFRRFMQNPPSELGNAAELLCDADAIIELNRSGATAGWPANQLALGDNGCGDVYSIDLDDFHGAVYLSGPHSGCESPDEDDYFEKVFDLLEGFSLHLIRMRGGSVTGEQSPSGLTPENAWQRLIGKWNYTFKSSNSLTVMGLQFTPDCKLIRSTSMTGGVITIPMTNETVTDITDVANLKDAILLTLGPSPMGRAGAVLTIRFVSANQIAIEGGPTYTREE